MSLGVIWTTQFKKDYKKASKRNLPDWLLIYRIEYDILVLTLVRTGSHGDLF